MLNKNDLTQEEQINMKEYIRNLSIGLAILSMLLGISILIFNVIQFISKVYVFNLDNALLTLLIVIVLHGSSIIGKLIHKLLKKE